jgi:hypothetical protein
MIGLQTYIKGGPGSGNFGHVGRPGMIGGSGEGGGSAAAPEKITTSFKSLKKEFDDRGDNTPFDKTNLKLEAYRIGKEESNRGIFFSADYKGALAYASIHPGHAVQKYEINLNKALIAGHQNSVSKLFWNKSYGDMIDSLGQRLRSSVLGGRAFDKKVMKEAVKRGYDGIIYTNPAPPAGMEVVVFYKKNLHFKSLSKIFIKGGPGSGNFGHVGRPGVVGGSGEGGGSAGAKPKKPIEFTAEDVFIDEYTDKLKSTHDAYKIFGNQLHIQGKNKKTIEKNLSYLDKFSDEILQKLKDRNVNIYMGDNSIVELDDNGYLKGKNPRGWPPNMTWDDCGGCYNDLKNVLSIGNMLGGSASVAGHELGHAIQDEIINKTPERRKQLVDLHKRYSNTFDYYFQQGKPGNSVGTQEMFAEMMAHIAEYGEVLADGDSFSDKKFAKEANKLIKKWGLKR